MGGGLQNYSWFDLQNLCRGLRVTGVIFMENATPLQFT